MNTLSAADLLGLFAHFLVLSLLSVGGAPVSPVYQ